jgi:hypothetical protein
MTYTVEPHGAGWALYKGRTNDRHGYRLCNLTDGDHAIYAAIADALNRADAAEAVRVKAESNLQKVQIPTSTIPKGFIPWRGGKCPVASGTVVSVRFRSQVTSREVEARHVGWDGSGRGPWGIIAYRIHKPADFRLEAGKFYVTASGERVGPMRHSSGAYGSTYHDSGDWGRWWWPNGEIGLLGSGDPDILALSSNQESGHE